MKYRVVNKYDVPFESEYQSVEVALRAADKCDGVGWIVLDDDDNQWIWYFGRPYKIAKGVVE